MRGIEKVENKSLNYTISWVIFTLFCRLGFSRLRNVMKSFCASRWLWFVDFSSFVALLHEKLEKKLRKGKIDKKQWQISTRSECYALNGKSPIITTIYHFPVDQPLEFIGECQQKRYMWMWITKFIKAFIGKILKRKKENKNNRKNCALKIKFCFWYQKKLFFMGLIT